MNEDSEKEQTNENIPDPYEIYNHGFPCCIYFAIDASEEMFQKNPETGETYFDQSLKIYRDVVLEKCRWNSVDHVGLLLFSVNKNNAEPLIENVYVMQELKCVNKDMATDIYEKCQIGIDLSSDKNYNLLGALSHAQSKLLSVEKSMSLKKIVLFTCQDNPYDGDDEKRHKVRFLINSFKDLDLQFEVVNFGESWNDELFWKDIRLIFDPTLTVNKPISEIVFELKKPARVYREVELEICEGTKVKVSIHNIIRSNTLLQKKNLNAESNEELTTQLNFTQKTDMDDSLVMFEAEVERRLVLKEDVTYVSKEYGKQTAMFTAEEKFELLPKMTGKTLNFDIKILGFQNLDVKVQLHFKTPYFVTWSKKSTPEEKKFFAALLQQCSSLEKMAICLHKSHHNPKLYSLIPCEEKGGFFLYPLPFKDQMRNWLEWDVSKEAYKKQVQNGFDEEKVSLITKMINKTKIGISDCRLKNPTLNQQLSCIQALALGEESPREIEDDTKKRLEEFKNKVKEPVGIYEALYPPIQTKQQTLKRPLDNTEKEKMLEEIGQAIEQNRIEKYTLEKLKVFADVLKVSKQGRKAQVVNRIIQKYNIVTLG